MKSPYGVVRNLEANCHDLVPLPIELRTYQSNYSISSWRENFSPLIPNCCKLIVQVCYHTCNKQIGLPLRGRPILLSLV